jgi:MSHA biogenesis protein MshG
MSRYKYTARGPHGAIDGVMEGATPAQVAESLVGKGLVPLVIKPENAAVAALSASTPAVAPSGASASGGTPANGSSAKIEWSTPEIKPQDVMLFSRQIYTLFKAGVPILRALAGLQETTANLRMRQVLYELRRSLESGVELSSSMAAHPKVFDNFYVAMIRVGEASGQLESVFIKLYKHLEFEQFMRQQVKSAVRYPSFVIMAMVAAVAIINIMVIPAFAGVFKSLGAELPLPTKILIATSNFTLNYGWYLLGAIVVGVFLLKQWLKTSDGRMTWDRWLLRMPLVGPIVTQATLARFARAFALSLKSGVPMERALSNVAQTADNTYICTRIETLRETVIRGETLTRAAAQSGVFTPMVLQMLAIGEETGMLDELLEEIGELYGSEVEYSLKSLSQQIEPILVIFLGAIVLLLALGVFMPMWDMGKVTLKH